MTARRVLLLVNGLFLALIGGVQVVLELVAYYRGAGPYGDLFHDSPYTIGWVEAHGLAFLIGVLLLVVATRERRRFWHGFLVAVHVLLGGANLLFWNSFVAFGVVPMGIAATIAHGLFVVAHTASLVASRTRTQAATS